MKTLLNVIGNVIEDEAYDDRIIKRDVLTRYGDTYTTLMDRKVPLQKKKKLLQKAGYIYLPIFLEIVGDDVDEFTPRVVNHTLKNCPLCNTKRLKRLPNHLRQVHGITDTKEWVQKANESAIDTDETDEEIM